MNSQSVVEFVRRGIAEKQELSYICENIMNHCLAPASDMSGIGCDNMTMMIVGILNGKTKEEWYNTISERVAKGDGPVAPVASVEPIADEEHGTSSAVTGGATGAALLQVKAICMTICFNVPLVAESLFSNSWAMALHLPQLPTVRY